MKLIGLSIFLVCSWILTLLPSDYELDQEMRALSLSVTGSSYTTSTTTTTLVTIQPTRTTVQTQTPVVVAQNPEPVPSQDSATTAPTSMGVRCGDWTSVAVKAGWPEERLELLLNDIIWDESRCQPNATNGSDHGLLQINWSTWSDYVESFGFTRDDLYIPEINLWIGAQIAAKATEAGWRWCQPWDSSQVRTCGQ